MTSIYDHPLLTTDYYIKTPTYCRLHQQIVNWIYTGTIGAYIWGRPRNGKSSFIQEAKETFYTRKNERIPSICFIAKTISIPTENKFYTACLYAVNHKHKKSGNETDKRERFLNYIKEIAYTNEERRVLFLIDEAQKLPRLYYELFSDVFNELKMAGFKSCYFFFWQRSVIKLH